MKRNQNPVTLPSKRSSAVLAPVLVHLVLLLGTGCPSSGLDAYNTKDLEEPWEGENPDQDEPPPLELDECTTACDLARAEASWLGCTVDCDIGIAADYEGSANVTIISPLGFIGVSGDVESDGGGSCDMVLTCPAPTECQYVYLACTQSSPDPESWGACFEEYLQCELEQQCAGAQTSCATSAGIILEACLAIAVTTEEIADCELINEDALIVCQCLYDACLSGDSGLACDDEQGEDVQTPVVPSPPPPIQIGPSKWHVSRKLISAQLARISALDTEIAIFPVIDGENAAWKGLRLMSVDPSNIVYSLGLRNGDVLIEANGINLSNASLTPAILLELRKAPQIRLVLRRGPHVRQFIYELGN